VEGIGAVQLAGVDQGHEQVTEVPSSKATHKLPRSPRMNSRTVRSRHTEDPSPSAGSCAPPANKRGQQSKKRARLGAVPLRAEGFLEVIDLHGKDITTPHFSGASFVWAVMTDKPLPQDSPRIAQRVYFLRFYL
jgi:hypothetical protein